MSNNSTSSSTTSSTTSSTSSSNEPSFTERLLTDAAMQRKAVTSMAIGGTLIGVFGGVVYAIPRRFRSSRGAVFHAFKALAGGTAACILGAVVIVKTTTWLMDVDSVPDFNRKVRHWLKPYSKHVIKQPRNADGPAEATTLPHKDENFIDWLFRDGPYRKKDATTPPPPPPSSSSS
jgi:hypothetical protein